MTTMESIRFSVSDDAEEERGRLAPHRKAAIAFGLLLAAHLVAVVAVVASGHDPMADEISPSGSAEFVRPNG